MRGTLHNDRALRAILEPLEKLPDPGWGRKRDMPLALLAPFLVARRSRSNSLVVLRTVFVAFATALPLIGIVTIVLTTGSDPIEKDFNPLIVLPVVGAIGALLVLLSPRFERDLPCETAAGLAEGYRVRFFQRIAFSEASALIGFVAFILSGRSLAYFVGAAWTALGFARLAPTVANLKKDQQDLDARGCELQLSDCLQSTPVP